MKDDPQTAAVYMAEKVLSAYGQSELAERCFRVPGFLTASGLLSPYAFYAYLDGLRAGTWFRDAFPKLPGFVEIQGTRGGTSKAVLVGSSLNPEIHLSAAHREPRHAEVTFLHELAHLTVLYEPDSTHGPEFAGNYLVLVAGVLGANASRGLEASYLKHGVMVTAND